jgi:hypothetical protein
MNLITATELRTKTKELVEALLNGEEVGFVHRSKIIGVFKPKKPVGKPFDTKKVMAIAAKLIEKYPILTDKEIDKRYREAMMKKHGKHLH